MKSMIKIVAITLMIVTICGVFLWMKNSVSTEEIIKTSVTKKEISDKKYILCQRIRVTGFDWMVIQTEDGTKTREFCNIIGSDPYEELNLNYEFFMADNTFVFYVEERKAYYSEEMKLDMVEYVVTGWDVLYPVKHGDLSGFLKTNKHIIKSDTDLQND